MNKSDLDTTVGFTIYDSIRGTNKYVYFTVIFSGYILSVFINISLMFFIILESSLHQPMFIFLFNLIFIGFIESTAIWPKVLQNLLSDTQTSSYGGCLCQVFMVSVYAAGTFSILTVMAYERYVSIINPLQYHIIMTPQKVKQLLALGNIVPICSVSGQICLTLQVPLCSNTIPRLYCESISVAKLSCVFSQWHRMSTLYGTSVFVISAVIIVFFVLFSYIRIIAVSIKASKNSQHKAISTCAPHLIVLINFSLVSLFSVIYNHFKRDVSIHLQIVFGFQFSIIPTLLHPIIYGIKTRDIRECVLKYVRGDQVATGGSKFNNDHYPLQQLKFGYIQNA